MKESDIVDLLDTIRTSIYATPVVNEYLLTAFIKLTTRLQQPAQINRVRNILSQCTGNLNVELQQRAVEYGNLFEFDEIRKGVVERMPAPEIREENRVLGEAAPKKGKGSSRRSVHVKQSASKDLLNILGGEEEATSPTVFGGKEKNAELLQDLFGPSPSGPSANGGGPSQPARSNVSDIMGLFGNTGAGVPVPVAPAPALSVGGGSMQGLEDLFGRREEASPPQTQTYRISTSLVSLTSAPIVAYSKNDLTVSLQPTRTGPGRVSIQAIFRNDSIGSQFEKVNMQAAVPKSQKLKLEPISSASIAVGDESTQSLRITAAVGVFPVLRFCF